MKKFIGLMLLVLMTSQFNMNIFASKLVNNDLAFAPEEKSVEVYYFHYSRRCATCEAVENETKNAIEENFLDLMKDGRVTFMLVNIEEEANRTLVDEFEIGSQTLMFACGDKQVDLTNDAFMNARTKPDKYKKKVKKTIEELLK